MNILYTDLETRSEAELRGNKSVGVYNYSIHATTQILMQAWAMNDDPYKIWEPHLGSMPNELLDAMQDPQIRVVAFNSTFERYHFSHKLGITIPIERFEDPQPSARYLSLPGDLEDCSTILGLTKDYAKDKEGKRLIDLFSKPHKVKKARRKKGEEATADTWFFHDWDSNPEDWELFKSYCGQDVIAEREVLRREKLLGAWPLPPNERKIWIFDQKVNDRGIPVNREFVKKAFKLAEREKKETIAMNDKITSLENSNSPSQLLDWATDRGYRGKNDENKLSLDKDAVAKELKTNVDLDPICRKVLENRAAAASTSYQKMAAILRQINPDDRLRGQFIYMGSSRCGRWSGNAVQLHNLAKPNEIFENEENIDKARALINAEEYRKIKELFESVLLVVKYNVRTAFETKKGKRFNISDLNAIETRVGAWVSGCQPLLEVFAQGRDPYLDFSVKMTQIAYEILARDVKSKDPAIKAKAKKNRQIAKPAVLGCIYRMGAKTLMEYAEGYGVKMSLAEAEQIVKVFREAYKEIVQMWFRLEEEYMAVMNGPHGTIRYVGPNNCIKIDKFVFDSNGNVRTILRIQLPSGRYLHYMDASIESTLMPWKDKNGNDVYRDALCYATQDQETKQWIFISTHGGKVFENIVQGIARDVLAEKMLMFEEAGMPVVLHVHDEAVTETNNGDLDPGLPTMEWIMAQPIKWAPGLPLGSDGFEGIYYKKN
jgi:DNA polymerase